MSWRRGRGTVNVELANVQSKIESWSDEFDGEDGLIQTFRDAQAETKALLKVVKLALWVSGVVVGLPALALSVIELVRMAQGR